MSVVNGKTTFGSDSSSYSIISPTKSVCVCLEEEELCKSCKEKSRQLNFDMSYDLRGGGGRGGGGSYDAALEKLVASDGVATNVPDGGWGWMVAIGSFIVMMLIPMLFPCFGILFSGYLLESGTSTVTTAWIFNIQGFLWNIMGLFVRPLVDEFGWRVVGFVGITLVSTSIFVSAFTPSPLFLFFSLSLLSGVGGGLVTSMCFLIVPIYFEKRRGMANTIMMAGICSGEILGPLLVRLLLEAYGFKGANMIIGAILLNGYIGILFFHPVEWHMKRTNQRGQQQQQHFCPETMQPLVIQTKDDVKNESTATSPYATNLEINGSGAAMLRERILRKDDIRRSSFESLPQRHGLPNNSWTAMSASLRSLYSGSWSGSLQDFVVDEPKKTQKTKDSSGEESGSVMVAIFRLLRGTFSDLTVLRSPRAAIIAIGNMLCMNSALNFVMMVPFAMQALDHTLQDAAWCISVSAICNLLTRLVVSPLSDWERFSMKLCYMGGYAVLAISMLVFPMLSDLKWLEGVMGLFGCALGANMALYNLVMIEYMGVENLAPVFGASGLMVGVGFLIFGTTIGLVRDMSGSYSASIWMLSAMVATSFILWLLMPTAVAYDKRRNAKTKGDGNNVSLPPDRTGQQPRERSMESSA